MPFDHKMMSREIAIRDCGEIAENGIKNVAMNGNKGRNSLVRFRDRFFQPGRQLLLPTNFFPISQNRLSVRQSVIRRKIAARTPGFAHSRPAHQTRSPKPGKSCPEQKRQSNLQRGRANPTAGIGPG
jgi:hypothetical protein